jgi:hypothetical protein
MSTTLSKIEIANTELSHNFDTWRLNTNFISTLISNNVVTVNPGGDMDRGGYATGNSHVEGTFSAATLRTNRIIGSNSAPSITNEGIILVSNTTVNCTSFTVGANTVFSGNVVVNTTGSEVFDVGDISRLRISGGSNGKFIRKSQVSADPSFNNTITFEHLRFRDITDLSSNSSPIILSGANTAYYEASTHGADYWSSPRFKFNNIDGLGATLDSYSFFVPGRNFCPESPSITDPAPLVIELNDAAGGTGISIRNKNSLAANSKRVLSINSYGEMFANNVYIQSISANTLGSFADFSANNVSSSLIPSQGSLALGSLTNRWHELHTGATFITGDLLTANVSSSEMATADFAGTVLVRNNLTVNEDLTVLGDTYIQGETIVAPEGTFTDLVSVTSAVLRGTIQLGDASSDVVTLYSNIKNPNLSNVAPNYDLIVKTGKLYANNFVNNYVITSDMLKRTGVQAGFSAGTITDSSTQSFGSSTKVPVVEVGIDGRIVAMTEADVAGVSSVVYNQNYINSPTTAPNSIKVHTTDNQVFTASIDAAGYNAVDAYNYPTNKGVASFNSEHFALTSGAVSLLDATTGAVMEISGTADEIAVSRTAGTVQIALPDDITIAGNLTVTGTTTSTETVNVNNNMIHLNYNMTGLPTLDAGIAVERGDSNDVEILWIEDTARGEAAADRWSFTNDGTTYYNFPIPSEYDNFTSWSITADGVTSTVSSEETLTVSEGNGIDLTLLDQNLTVANNDRGSSQPIFKTVTVSDDDTGYTWGETGSITAGNNTDSFNYISGAGINVNIDSSGNAFQFAIDHLGLESLSDPGSDRIAFWDDSASAFKWLSTSTGLTITDTSLIPAVASLSEPSSGGISVSNTSGAHEIDIKNDLRGKLQYSGIDASNYYQSAATTHDWYLATNLDMRLETGGNLHVDGSISSYSTVTTSDRNLKENITTVENALDKVLQLNGVEFNWKKDGKLGAGVIAQDVEAVLPQAVSEVEDLNDSNSYKAVQYDALHSLLIEAIKELKAEIDELKGNK